MTAPRLRKPIRIWLWLVGSILAIWLAAIAYYTFGIPHEVIHLDPLLDIYLDALGVDGRRTGDALEKYQANFPNDPRLADLSVLEWQGQSDWTSELDYIKELRDSGVKVSAAVAFNYLKQLELTWMNESATYNAPAVDPQMQLPREVRQQKELARSRQVCREVDQKHRAERDRLYTELQSSASRSSLVWYATAELEFKRGNNAKAIKFLDKGNAASHNTNLLPYPLPTFIEDLRTNGPLAQDPRAGKLVGLLIVAASPNFISMRRMHGELWDWAMHAGNSAALNTLHQYACRVGTSEDGTLIDALVAQMMISRECKSLQKSALAPSHQQAVSKLQALQSQVNVDLKTISQNNTFMNTIGKKQGLLDFLKSRSATYYLKLQVETLANEQTELVNKIFPQFDRIAKFDFTTMSFKP